MDECLEINKSVNSRIIDYFDIDSTYPVPCIKTINKNLHESNTGFIQEMFIKNLISGDNILKEPIYLDQLVYFNKELRDGIIEIDAHKMKVTYKCTADNAEKYEEILLAFMYINDIIIKKKLDLHIMSVSDENIKA